MNALERGAELGECVRVIETELAKRELPGDVRRANRQVGRPFLVFFRPLLLMLVGQKIRLSSVVDLATALSGLISIQILGRTRQIMSSFMSE